MPSPRTAPIAAALAGVLGMGCLLHREPAPCIADRDCKLDRICDTGRCVWAEHRGAKGATRSSAVPVAHSAAAPELAPPTAAAVMIAPVAPVVGAMFRGGPEHRGRSPHLIPARRPEAVWAYETRGPVTSSPVVTADGHIAFGSHDGSLHVLDPKGTPHWSFATDDLIFSSPAAVKGVVYVGSDDDHLYALDLTTKKMAWRFRVGSCRHNVGVGPEASRCDVDAGPTIGPDGVIYTGGDAIYAINPDGTLRWRFRTGGHVSSAPALLPDGTVVAGSQDNLIYAVAADGTKRWDFRAGGDVESSPAVGDDGTVYVGSDDGKLYALSPKGQRLWAFTAGDDIRASPAIGADGTIFVGAFDSLMYAIRRDGTLAWTFRTGDRILSSALVDASGSLLFGSQDDRLYALEPDGRHRWSVELGGDVDSSPIVTADGVIYVGTDDKKLYALGAGRAEVSLNDR